MAASSGLHSHRFSTRDRETTVKGMRMLYHTEKMTWPGAALTGEINGRTEVGN